MSVEKHRREALALLEGKPPARVFTMAEFDAWRKDKTPAEVRELIMISDKKIKTEEDFFNFRPLVQYGLTSDSKVHVEKKVPCRLSTEPCEIRDSTWEKIWDVQDRHPGYAGWRNFEAMIVNKDKDVSQTQSTKPPAPSRVPDPQHQQHHYNSRNPQEQEEWEIQKAIEASLRDMQEQATIGLQERARRSAASAHDPATSFSHSLQQSRARPSRIPTRARDPSEGSMRPRSPSQRPVRSHATASRTHSLPSESGSFAGRQHRAQGQTQGQTNRGAQRPAGAPQVRSRTQGQPYRPNPASRSTSDAADEVYFSERGRRPY